MNERFQSVIYGASVLVVLMLAYFIFRRLGLTQKKPSDADIIFEDRMTDQMKSEQFLKDTRYLDPSYWKDKSFKYLTNESLIELSKKLDSAFKSWYWGGDDEPAIYGVFESLESGAQLSQLAEMFQKMYGSSLRGKLFDKLDNEELAIISGIINRYR